MTNKLIVMTIVIIITLITTIGCWDRTEPEDLAIVLSVIYDYDPEKEEYILIIEYIDAKATGAAQEAPTERPSLIHVSHGATLAEAIREGHKSFGRVIYGGNNRLRIFTERMAINGVEDTVDFFLRDGVADEKPILMVYKGEDPLKLYSSQIGLTDLLGDYILNMSLNHPAAIAVGVFPETLQFIQSYYSEGRQPVMGVIETRKNEAYEEEEGEQSSGGEGSAKEYKIVVEGMAVFKDNKFVGYMDSIETRAYNFITDDSYQGVYLSTKVNDELVVASAEKPDIEIKTYIQNNKLSIEITAYLDIKLTENHTKIDPGEINNLEIFQDAFNQMFQDQILSSINTAQKYKSDVFGIGEYYNRQHPKDFKSIKNEWDDRYFANADINVTINTTLSLEGEIKEPYITGEQNG